MGAYTTSQLLSRLAALLLGLLGGLCQLVWSHVIGMNCDPTQLGEYVMIFQCPSWTELFLRFPAAAAPALESVALAAGIAGLLAGGGAVWRPRWSALLFAALAAVNLALVAGAVVSAGERQGLAAGLGILAIVIPLAAAAIAWRWGEYRG